MDLQACQRCGSTDLRAPSIGDGSLPGLSDVQWFVVCRRCGLRDVPLTFDDVAALKDHQVAMAGWEDADPQGEAAARSSEGAPPEAGTAPMRPGAEPPRERVTFAGRLIVGWGVFSLVAGLALVGAVLVTGTEVPSVVLLLGLPVGIAQAWAFIVIGRRMRERLSR